MALYDTRATNVPALSTSVLMSVLRTITRLADWSDELRTRRALSRLSTMELHDIGLTRGDIDGVARRF